MFFRIFKKINERLEALEDLRFKLIGAKFCTECGNFTNKYKVIKTLTKVHHDNEDGCGWSLREFHNPFCIPCSPKYDYVDQEGRFYKDQEDRVECDEKGNIIKK